MVQRLAKPKAFSLSRCTHQYSYAGWCTECAVFIYFSFLVGVMCLVDRLLVITEFFSYSFEAISLFWYISCVETALFFLRFVFLCFGVGWRRGCFFFFLLMVYFLFWFTISEFLPCKTFFFLLLCLFFD